jgi:Zn-dependent protease
MDTRTGVFKLVTVGGVGIKLHWSWLLILLFLTWSLAQGNFPALIPDASSATYWVLGGVSALLFFASILVHELSHSFVAIARGYKVRDIVLFIFGGVSNIEEEPKTAGDEFLIAAVGPFSSLVLAGLFFVLAIPLGDPVRTVFGYLSWVNLLLGWAGASLDSLGGYP